MTQSQAAVAAPLLPVLARGCAVTVQSQPCFAPGHHLSLACEPVLSEKRKLGVPVPGLP